MGGDAEVFEGLFLGKVALDSPNLDSLCAKIL